jgi:hypothetical protein
MARSRRRAPRRPDSEPWWLTARETHRQRAPLVTRSIASGSRLGTGNSRRRRRRTRSLLPPSLLAGFRCLMSPAASWPLKAVAWAGGRQRCGVVSSCVFLRSARARASARVPVGLRRQKLLVAPRICDRVQSPAANDRKTLLAVSQLEESGQQIR